MKKLAEAFFEKLDAAELAQSVLSVRFERGRVEKIGVQSNIYDLWDWTGLDCVEWGCSLLDSWSWEATG